MSHFINSEMLLLSILAFLVTFSLIKIFLPFFKKYFISIPNNRSSHTLPTPSAGGLAFVIPVVLIEIIFSNYYPLICTPLAIIGAIDDRKSVPSSIRFSIQILTVFIIVLLNLNNLIELSNFNVFSRVLIYFIFILIGTTIINFINFMDGIDGIISINAVIFFAFIAFFLNSNYFIVLFSLLAFLYFNWNPAKIFMGDVGSNFIGSILFLSLFEAKDGIDFIFIISKVNK